MMSKERTTRKPPDLENAVQNYLKTGSQEAKTEVIKVGSALVDYYAGIYSPAGQPDEDLKKAARQGFIQSLKRFDPNREVTFSTYATHCIISEIRQELKSRKLFKTPDWLKRLQDDVINATEELARDNKTLPTLQDIAQKLNIAEKGITETMQAGNIPVKEIDFSALKSIRRETFKLPIEDVITIRKSMDRLGDVQKRVLSLISVNLRELSKAMEEEEAALTKDQVRYLRMAENCGEDPDCPEFLNSYKLNFPREFQEEEVLRYFEVLADEFGLRLVEQRFNGRPENIDNNYNIIPFELDLEGRYRGLLQLLDHLRNKENAVKVDRVRTSRKEKVPARISIYITAKAFFKVNGSSRDGIAYKLSE